METEEPFLRAIREDPDKNAIRLVFADWLEERGDPLGDFIRDQCALADMPPRDTRRPKLMDHAREILTKHGKEWSERFSGSFEGQSLWKWFLGKATVPLQAFLEYRTTLQQIASKYHVVADLTRPVDLTGVTIPQAIIELVPDSVARENIVLPLESKNGTMLMAVIDLHDQDTIQKLEFILNKRVAAVLVEREQLIDSINRHYGETETEPVDCCFGDWHESGIDLVSVENDACPETPATENITDLVARLVDLIIQDAISSGARAIRVDPLASCGRVYYHIGENWVERDSFPLGLMDALLSRIKSLATIKPATKNGLGTGRFTVSAGRKYFDLRVKVRLLSLGQSVEIGILPENSH
jgi:uncharacterized protein (TIGR02996 family)